MSDACLMLFAKSPEPGKVKTRLCPPLTPEQAMELYRVFLQDIADACRALDRVVRVLAYAGVRSALEPLVGADWQAIPQEGADLGERLIRAVQWAQNEGYRRVAVIGSDSPDLPVSYLQQAFDELQHADVVLGPSMDGGYYLVGFGQPERMGFQALPTIFENITWSTDQVFQQTLERLSKDTRLALLPPWYDVDTEHELRFLWNHLRAIRMSESPLQPARTYRLLEAYFTVSSAASFRTAPSG